MHTVPLSGWGHHPVVEARVIDTEDLPLATRGAALSRGLGRAYGDAALPAPGETRPVVRTPAADRILAFDPTSGVLRAEAGLSLATLARLFLPRGWFTPVSPGTRYVTLGGMVAADIHGKGHHVDGTFGRYVHALRMRLADGEIVETSRTAHPDLFRATLGGMGLTGHVLEVEFALKRVETPWIYEESVRLGSLDEVFAELNAASRTWPMTVAWMDTSARGARRGRGIVMRGRWANPGEAPPGAPPYRTGIPFPVTLPSGLLNATTLGLANAVFWHKHPRREVRHVVSPATFFWQLDIATGWNRAYGRRGFTQHQCVLPSDVKVHGRFLDRFQALGACSFVTVFKDCGDEGEGLLSFPQRGTTIAVDIPIRDVAETARIVRELNAFVIDHGGRIYLAKDAFSDAGELRRMYPRWEQFEAVRQRYDPHRKLKSSLSVRLFGDAAP